MLGFLGYIITTTLRMGIPIGYTALGGVVSERSGVNNIGLEGIMIAGAFFAVVGSNLTGSPWFGILLAILMGVLISAIHSVLTITMGAKQAVSSMALVLLAEGSCGVAIQAIFQRQGSTPQVANLSSTPFLSKIPVVGNFLSNQSPFVYLSLVCLILVHLLFSRTRFGLRITAIGENPIMAATTGIKVQKTRYISVLLSGVLGGLGGAMLSIGSMNLYQEGMIAGRGYLALGAVTMGRWNPIGVFLASLLFGFFDALQLYLQTIPQNPIPSEFIQMLPYLSILIILALSSKNLKYFGITASGQPYTKYIQ
jgi:simple sugar transport system permease protein